jgi:hypothetical protein
VGSDRGRRRARRADGRRGRGWRRWMVVVVVVVVVIGVAVAVVALVVGALADQDRGAPATSSGHPRRSRQPCSGRGHHCQRERGRERNGATPRRTPVAPPHRHPPPPVGRFRAPPLRVKPPMNSLTVLAWHHCARPPGRLTCILLHQSRGALSARCESVTIVFTDVVTSPAVCSHSRHDAAGALRARAARNSACRTADDS